MKRKKRKCGFCSHSYGKHLESWDTLECSKCNCYRYIAKEVKFDTDLWFLSEAARDSRYYKSQVFDLRNEVSSLESIKSDRDRLFEEKGKWEGLGQFAASILVGYFSIHNKEMKLICPCGLCHQVFGVLKAYGIEIMTPEKAEKMMGFTGKADFFTK